MWFIKGAVFCSVAFLALSTSSVGAEPGRGRGRTRSKWTEVKEEEEDAQAPKKMIPSPLLNRTEAKQADREQKCK